MSATVQNIEITPDDVGVRLDRYLRKKFPQLTQGWIEMKLRKGDIRLDGKRIKANERLAAGQTIKLPPLPADDKPPLVPRAATAAEIKQIKSYVIYEDDELIVLNKPAGLAVQGGSKITTHVDALSAALVPPGAEIPKLGHRLDKDTSGVLVMAKSAKVARWLTYAFQQRDVKKYYLAITEQVPEPRQGRITAPLTKKPVLQDGEMVVVDEANGKTALTDYAVLDTTGKKFALVALWPRTGRTHQLRVHLTCVGAPIVGDDRYNRNEPVAEDIPDNLYLHAYKLEIEHPKGKLLTFTAPLPPHFLSAMDTLGLAFDTAADPFEALTK